MSTTPLSTTKEARDLYETLLRRTVEVSPDYKVLKPDEESGCCAALFSDATGAICAARTMDLNLCAYAGAALQLAPAAGIQDCINNGCLDDDYTEDVYEVLNVFSLLFNREGAPHVFIDLIYTPGEELPASEYKVVASYVERRDSVLDIEGYDEGRSGAMCFS